MTRLFRAAQRRGVSFRRLRTGPWPSPRILFAEPALSQPGKHMRGRPGHRVDRRIKRQMNRPCQQMQPATAGPSISLVADDRRTERGAMHPDLVRSPGVGPQFQPGPPIGSANNLPVRAGRLAGSLVHDHAPPARPGRSAQRCCNRAMIAENAALNHRPVCFAHEAGREQRLRRDQRRPPQRDDKATGGIGVQPMHEPRSILAAGQDPEPVFDAVPSGRAGMHRQPGRLVDHNEALVLEQDGRVHRPRVAKRPDRQKPAFSRLLTSRLDPTPPEETRR
jgi:hypothetical protein